MISFKTANQLEKLINEYFASLEDAPQNLQNISIKDAPEQKPFKKESRPALLTALALQLGFTSMADFVAYERKGRFKNTLKTGRLRIQSEYEKKLHNATPTGAMFALRCMGWNDKPTPETHHNTIAKFKINIVDAGPPIAHTEKDVVL